MGKLKKIEKIIPPPPQHWVGNGFKVHTFFPSEAIEKDRMSPFYLLDYNGKIEFPPNDSERGVGPHPHRGFETVTIAYNGKVAHHDSAGNHGIINEGDVQWMTAGSGVLHKEYQERSFVKSGGLFQMVQLWINLPAKYKMSDPKYQTLTHNEMGKYQLSGEMGTVNVIAGDFRNINGPAKTFTPMQIYDIRLAKNAKILINLPQDYNTGLLVIDGKIKINDAKEVTNDHFALFDNSGHQINILAIENAVLLVLSGKPLNEPIFQYGPFLMNTKTEIIEAFDDYNNGKFGYLE